MGTIQRGAPFVLPISLIACLMVLLIPLPPGVTDLLLAINLGGSALIVLTTISIRTPLEFSVFPTLLLTTTLARLVLNIATTRLILSSANSSGLDAAGGIIRGFGQFVAGDQLSVGIIIFAILVVVQFVVVTKGATRISEVAARFALDGMPGRQMAIDADLNAGIIDSQEAKRQRDQLGHQADFYGAMDGASKYVRGDAIAGIFIISINVLGGLYMGLVESGMTLNESLETYIKLAIGDGLVSQLPALLLSIAAGILVSRGSRSSNLPIEFLEQLFRRPEPLFVAGGFLALLVFAQLPALPLLLVGAACVAMALAFRSGTPWPTSERNSPAPTSATAIVVPPTKVEQFLSVDPFELELGVALLRLADPNRGGDLLDRISRLRNQTAADLGIVLPKVRIRDNLRLAENAFRIRLLGNEIAREQCYPLRTIVSGPDIEQIAVDGIPAVDPLTGNSAVWIDPAEAESLIGLRVRSLSAIEFVIGHLQRVTRTHAADLLTRDAVKLLLDRTRDSAPAIVEEVLSPPLSLAEVQATLKCLVSAGVSIRNLPTILEAICDSVHQAPDFDGRVEQIRKRLGRSIITPYTEGDGCVSAITLADDVEDWFADHAQDQTDLQDHSINQLIETLVTQSATYRVDGPQPVLLVKNAIRQSLQDRLRNRRCHLVVLGREEVTPYAEIREVKNLSWTSLQDSDRLSTAIN